MPKQFDLDKAVIEFRRVTDCINEPGSPAEEQAKLKERAAEFRAGCKAWNGDDELFEIAYGYSDDASTT